MRFWIIGLTLMIFLAMPSITLAQTFFASNSTGHVKDLFYTNESVYVYGSNLTNGSTSVRVYIMNDTSNYTEGMNLTDFRASHTTVTTIANGDLPPTLIWSVPNEGKFDVVLSANDTFENGTDFVDSKTQTGFEVMEVPIRLLKISKGSNSSSIFTWSIPTNGKVVPMMQVALDVNLQENILITGLALNGNGTGNERTGVDEVQLIEDSDKDGVYDSNETLLAFGVYNKDNGTIVLSPTSAYTVNANSSSTLLIVYKLFDESVYSSVNNTFQFILSNVFAKGAVSSGSVVINGTPLNSAFLTISAATPPPPVTNVTTTTTTTSTPTPTKTTTTTRPTPTTTTIPTTTATAAPPSIDTQTIILVAIAVIVPVAIILFGIQKLRKPWSGSRV